MNNLRGNQFKKAFISGLKFAIYKPDNCVLLKNGRVMIIKNIVKSDEDKILFIGKRFRFIDNLFQLKLSQENIATLNNPEKYSSLFFVSSSIDILKVSNLDNDCCCVNLDELKCKAVCIPISMSEENESFAVFPLSLQSNE